VELERINFIVKLKRLIRVVDLKLVPSAMKLGENNLGCGAGESNLDFRAEKSTTRILKLERLILVVKFVYTNWDGKEDTEL
jgi:hypothetical protein